VSTRSIIAYKTDELVFTVSVNIENLILIVSKSGGMIFIKIVCFLEQVFN